MKTWVMEDGPEQEKRDEILRAQNRKEAEDGGKESTVAVPVAADPTARSLSAGFRKYILGTDVVSNAVRYLDEYPL